MNRNSWDDFFFEVSKLVSSRSTCLRRQYGVVLVKDKTIISTGFNGSPRGYPHCQKCPRENYESGTHLEICRASHAEQNAVANAARFGICTKDSELYIWPGDLPCPACSKILINVGIKSIHYVSTNYPGWELSKDYFQQCGVELIKS